MKKVKRTSLFSAALPFLGVFALLVSGVNCRSVSLKKSVVRLQGQIEWEKEYLTSLLPSRHVTAHFIIHYDPYGPLAGQITRIGLDHEVAYQRYLLDTKVAYVDPNQLRALKSTAHPLVEIAVGLLAEGRINSYFFDRKETYELFCGISFRACAHRMKRAIFVSLPSAVDNWAVIIHELGHIFVPLTTADKRNVNQQILEKLLFRRNQSPGWIEEGFASTDSYYNQNKEIPFVWLSPEMRLLSPKYGPELDKQKNLLPIQSKIDKFHYLTSGSFMYYLRLYYGSTAWLKLYQQGQESLLLKILSKSKAVLLKEWQSWLFKRKEIDFSVDTTALEKFYRPALSNGAPLNPNALPAAQFCGLNNPHLLKRLGKMELQSATQYFMSDCPQEAQKFRDIIGWGNDGALKNFLGVLAITLDVNTGSQWPVWLQYYIRAHQYWLQREFLLAQKDILYAGKLLYDNFASAAKAANDTGEPLPRYVIKGEDKVTVGAKDVYQLLLYQLAQDLGRSYFLNYQYPQAQRVFENLYAALPASYRGDKSYLKQWELRSSLAQQDLISP